jgi:hypothetical protein
MPTTNPLQIRPNRDAVSILENLNELVELEDYQHNDVVLVRGAGYYRFDEKVFPPDPCEEGVRVVPEANRPTGCPNPGPHTPVRGVWVHFQDEGIVDATWFGVVASTRSATLAYNVPEFSRIVDCTGAGNRAIQFASRIADSDDDNRGATVLFPEGDIFGSFSLQSSGGSVDGNVTIAGRGRYVTRFYPGVDETVIGFDMIGYTQKNEPVFTTDPNRRTVRIQFRDLGIDGVLPQVTGQNTFTRPNGSDEMHGIHLQVNRHVDANDALWIDPVVIERVDVRRCQGQGIRLETRQNVGAGGAHIQFVSMRDLAIDECRNGALYLLGDIIESTISDVSITRGGQRGVSAVLLAPQDVNSTANNGPSGVTFINLTCNTNDSATSENTAALAIGMVHLRRALNIKMIGCDLEQAAIHLYLQDDLTRNFAAIGCKFQQEKGPGAIAAVTINACDGATFTACSINGNITDGIQATSGSTVANAKPVETHNLDFNGSGKAVNISTWTQIDSHKRIRAYARNMALAPYTVGNPPTEFYYDLEDISHYYEESGTPHNDQIADGYTVTLRPWHTNHVFTIVDDTGNIRTRSGANVTITGHQTITLRWYAELARWLEV